MSPNKFQPHLYILPEDDATRQIANGFLLNLKVNERVIKVLPEARGWTDVVDNFTNNHVSKMRNYSTRRMVLLIDFDNDNNRLDYVKEHIPDKLQDRVFVIGVFSNPEDLKQNINKNFEEIGETLADDCAENTNKLWRHELLQHNRSELDRMIDSVKPFLFS